MAQLGIGRVHRHVERRQALVDDPPERGLVQIGQRDVVAVEEREPVVIVLHVEAPPHTSRKLVDEAEHTLVRAGGDLARPWRLELEAEVAPAPSREPQHRPGAPALDLDVQLLLARGELEVDDVAKRLAVDRKQPVS
ncbi:MAG: hypothetical protein DMD82_08270, partial [Candidatus Rokuibacteriota bacterium]